MSDSSAKGSGDTTVPVRVVVRCRPQNKQEAARSEPVIVTCGKKNVTVRNQIGGVRPSSGAGGAATGGAAAGPKLTKQYAYDQVYGQYTKQEEIFKECVKPTIDEVLQGYSATVFAYGQTGTGKTFTMEGDLADSANAGIIPRSINAIFEHLESRAKSEGEGAGQFEYSVRISYLELYNEQLTDLLAAGQDDIPDEPIAAGSSAGGAGRSGYNPHMSRKAKRPAERLKLVEDAKKGVVVVQNLEEKLVHNSEEVFEHLGRALKKRQVAETKCNAFSSRSHGVFTIMTHSKEKTVEGEDLLRVGKLHLVDLAGSESVGRSGAKDKRLREAGNINQSLLTLGRVITSLVEKQGHVPYRDSKLTRLLRDSLGGKTKTTIIATLSPCAGSLDETLSTLDYASRARSIKNRPEANQRMTKRQLLTDFSTRIDHLQTMLMAARSKDGVHLPLAEFEALQNARDSAQAQLEELKEVHAGAEDEINGLKAELERCNDLLEEVRAELATTSEALEGTRGELAERTEELGQARERCEETGVLLEAHRGTGDDLRAQAEALVGEVRMGAAEGAGLRAKIARRDAERSRMASDAGQHRASVALRLQALIRDADKFRSGAAERAREAQATAGRARERACKHASGIADRAGEAAAEAAERAGRLAESVAAACERTSQGWSDLAEGQARALQALRKAAEDAGAAAKEARAAAATAREERAAAESAWARASRELLEQEAERADTFVNEHSAALAAAAQEAESELARAKEAVAQSLRAGREAADARALAAKEAREQIVAGLAKLLDEGMGRQAEADRESVQQCEAAAGRATGSIEAAGRAVARGRDKAEQAAEEFGQRQAQGLREGAGAVAEALAGCEAAAGREAELAAKEAGAMDGIVAQVAQEWVPEQSKAAEAAGAAGRGAAQELRAEVDEACAGLRAAAEAGDAAAKDAAGEAVSSLQGDWDAASERVARELNEHAEPFGARVAEWAAAHGEESERFARRQAALQPPTGTTPAKRAALVPSRLAAASPDGRVLARVRARREAGAAVTPSLARSQEARAAAAAGATEEVKVEGSGLWSEAGENAAISATAPEPVGAVAPPAIPETCGAQEAVDGKSTGTGTGQDDEALVGAGAGTDAGLEQEGEEEQEEAAGRAGSPSPSEGAGSVTGGGSTSRVSRGMGRGQSTSSLASLIDVAKDKGQEQGEEASPGAASTPSGSGSGGSSDASPAGSEASSGSGSSVRSSGRSGSGSGRASRGKVAASGSRSRKTAGPAAGRGKATSKAAVAAASASGRARDRSRSRGGRSRGRASSRSGTGASAAAEGDGESGIPALKAARRTGRRRTAMRDVQEN